jgi:two-component system, NtrC family, sensor kinase
VSIRLKTLLGIAAIEVALLLVLIANGVGFLRETSEDLLRARAQATAELIAATAVDAAVALDLGALETLARASAALPATVYVRIDDMAGRTLARADGPSAGADSETLRHAAEIRAAGRVFATVEVGLSTDDLAASVARARTRMGWIAAAEVALVALFGLLLGTAFVNRLRDLARGAARLAAGDLSVRLRPRGRDELATTAAAFNSMAEDLSRTLARLDAARAKAETRLAEAIDELPHAVALADSDGVVVFANPAFARTLGDMGLDVRPGTPLAMADAALAAGAVPGADGALQLPGGRAIVVHERRLPGGEAIRVHAEVTDLVAAVERNRRLESAMARARRLETLGSLAGGIAHEINTPVQFLGDNLRFLEEGFAHLAAGGRSGAFPTEEIPDALRQSREGVERIARIVAAVRDMAEPPAAPVIRLDVRETVERAAQLTVNLWRPHGTMATDVADGLPTLETRAGEIESVLVALIANAADAIEARGGGGTISISARSAGERVEIAVRDDGIGVPPELRSRIFDPFFTTKPPGMGTGQGLAIARAVIEGHHGGSLTLRAPPAGGAEFAIALPARAAAAEAIAA